MSQPVQAPQLDRTNLTRMEMGALDAVVNVSDGHARQDLSPSQGRIIHGLAELFRRAAGLTYPELDVRAHDAFFHALGQHASPIGSGRILSCYASSVAMEIVARALADTIRSVGLIHPTFDNIPDILRGSRLDLVPLDEPKLLGGDPAELFVPPVECLFITTPNNPTGAVLARRQLADIAAACADRDAVLVLDSSFRGFDRRAQYDHYTVLDRSGCRFVLIEDTGKLWPTLDLKAGFLVYSRNIRLPIAEIYSDIMLNVSPLILVLIESFARDAAAGGLETLHDDIACNRAQLRDALTALPVTFPDRDSVVSVERIRLDADLDGRAVTDRLRDVGVHVLPCGPFHWADQAEGARFLRIALARPRATVNAAASGISSVLTSML
jgi:enduracididine biosynthesis enzyme MppP